MKKIWSAIVVTCSDQDLADAFKQEIEIRQKKLLIHPETLVLCVVDPKPNIGSGGATLNAILQITENISARENYTVISSDVLQDKRILIIHMGTSTPYSACSPGFLPIPAYVENATGTERKYSALATQFDILYQMTINVMAEDSPYGFWICSCDRMIILPEGFKIDWSVNDGSVILFGVPVDIDVAAKQHGVIKIANDGNVADIIYKGSSEVLSTISLEDKKVPALSGIVFMTTAVAELLLNLSVVPPLDYCTYVGLDTGTVHVPSRPLPPDEEMSTRSEPDFVLSLFFDVLLCMTLDLKEKDYVHGQRSGVYGTVHFPDLDNVDRDMRYQARSKLWNTLNGTLMKSYIIEDSQFNYLGNDPSTIHRLLLNCPYQSSMETSFTSISFKRQASFLSLTDASDNKNFVVVNSYLKDATIGKDCVILHSFIKNDVFIGNNCMLVNIQSSDLEPLSENAELPNDIVIESFYLKMKSMFGSSRILVIFGIKDKLQRSILQPECTVFNESWPKFFERTGISEQEIWSPDIPKSKRCLLNARLFPVYHSKSDVNILHILWLQGSYKSKSMASFWRASWRLSLEDILDLCDPHAEFSWRKELFFEIGQRKVASALQNKKDNCFLAYFGTCVLDGYFEELLSLLDEVLLSSSDPAVISRTFACIADVLGCKANGLGGLRSGPAANIDWKPGLDLVQKDNLKDAVPYMANLRKNWFSRPDLLVRAARHYEAAFQIQIRKAVATARTFIKVTKGEMVPLNTWVTAQAPARSDIAGTWSDTPPICYEHSGSVVGIGINLDNKKPIGCRVKRIAECKIVLILGRDQPLKLELFEWDELKNYCQPNSTGALLKAALFCAEILPLKQHHNETLSEYLMSRYQGGFVINTWSNLPHGSGLGTSSILAGTVIASLWKVAGYDYTVESVLHAVLDLEQMLTTGGGWQDQVGGLCPGIKVGSSKRQLPLKISVDYIKCPDGFIEKFEKHLLVVFTGKTRLARNMLMDVLRNWNARFPLIVQTAASLLENAKAAISAFEQGDLEKLGECLDKNWQHKKLMAHGCEPVSCRQIMDQLRPHVYGQCLAGAGGGGFMYLITKQENAVEIIREELNKVKSARGKATVHCVTIDKEGLVVTVDDQPSDEIL